MKGHAVMGPVQEQHLAALKASHAIRLDAKYRDGAAKHGGDLLGKSAFELVEEAIDENLDQYAYLMALRDKLTG